MRFLLLLTALSFVFSSAGAQQKKRKAPQLTQQQQWLQNRYQQFYKKNKVNVSQQVVMQQITSLLRTSCSQPCPAAVPLPVEGLQLEGERINEARVKLKWHTLAEFNNRGFVVERRFDNQPSQFDSTGFVRGVGTSYGKEEYSLLDANAFDGKTFYRLRQVDIDGKSKYSNTIAIDGYTLPLSLRIIPNPTTGDNVAIQFIGFKPNEKLSLRVFDTKGSIIFQKNDVVLNGNGRYRLTGVHLLSGVYFVKASNETQTCSTRFLVQ